MFSPLPVNFNPRSPCGERPGGHHRQYADCLISIHAPPVGSDTRSPNLPDAPVVISIHAPPVGSDVRPGAGAMWRNYFNPRSPCGERPEPGTTAAYYPPFQSTLPLWGATKVISVSKWELPISIHAPPVGSDGRLASALWRKSQFQSTLPLWGATPQLAYRMSMDYIFQSTLPLWGATMDGDIRERLAAISIHAPPVGSDKGAATMLEEVLISIHAPPVGSDMPIHPLAPPFCYFNPRSPCGERQIAVQGAIDSASFQSTLPLWGATQTSKQALPQLRISIHAPPVGSDVTEGFLIPYPTISIHAPPVGSDHGNGIKSPPRWAISIHAPPVGSDCKDAQIWGRIFGEVFGFL